MKEQPEHTVRSLKQAVSLSERELLEMRASVQVFMYEHPARAPLFMRARFTIAALFSGRSGPTIRWKSAAAAFALILVLMTGTSYAAENSLPGQPLYPIKIAVNEPIQGALAVTPEAKADWQTTLADRRLQEAETLAAKGALTQSDTATIQTELQSETQNFQTVVSQLAQSPDNDAQVAVAQSNMQAALSAHAQILAALSASSTATSTRPELAAILNIVRAKAMLAASGRMQAEVALDESASSSEQVALTADGAIAQAQLDSARALIRSAGPDRAASSTIEAALSVASDTQATIQSADTEAYRGNYRKALNGFLNALSAAQETKVDVSASVDLGANISLSAASSTDQAEQNATTTATTTQITIAQ